MSKMLKKINFDICTFCNHTCSFCSNPDKRTKKAMTRFDEFIKAMDNVLRYVDTNELGLSAKGEVLLNKDLEKIIYHCKNVYKIPYIYISSNGALLDKQKALSVLESGLDSIKFSINATNAEVYKIVHGRDDFDKVIENFKNLLSLKKERFPKVKILISSVMTNLNTLNPKDEFKKIFGEAYSLINDILLYKENIPQKLYNTSTMGGGRN